MRNKKKAARYSARSKITGSIPTVLVHTIAQAGINVKPQTETLQFKRWFRDSKVVDENGKPLVVYHGTDSEFNIFDMDQSRANMDIRGAFFSPWEEDAAGYGRNVRAFYLSIQNPADEATAYKALKMFQGQNEAGVKARDYLIRQGYDGVNFEGQEYIAFYPTQIKSATDNIGTFDGENPDIRFSLSDYSEADIRDIVAILRPFAGTSVTKKASEYAQYLAERGVKDIPEKDALSFAMEAARLNNAEAH